MSNRMENSTLYDIFRACRLCGAGGGYKMPIIQSVVGFDCPDIELRQKIKDCVQLEVTTDDKMPPLICELCVDKVNDFYEFLNMCQSTNKKTRQRLGLPLVASGSAEGDCILGLSEPVYVVREPPKQSRMKVKPKAMQQPQAVSRKESAGRIISSQRALQKELESLTQNQALAGLDRLSRRDSRSSSTSSTSRNTRSTRSREETVALSQLKSELRPKRVKPIAETPTTKTTVHKSDKSDKLSEEDSMLAAYSKYGRSRSMKRPRDPEVISITKQTREKKLKLTIKLPPKPPPDTKPSPSIVKTPFPKIVLKKAVSNSPLPTKGQNSSKSQAPTRAGPKSRTQAKENEPMKAPAKQASTKSQATSKSQARATKSQAVTPLPSKSQATSVSNPLQCPLCFTVFLYKQSRNKHMRMLHGVEPSQDIESFPKPEPPLSETKKSGKCSKCNRTLSVMKYPVQHEISCKGNKKKDSTKVAPAVRKRLQPMHVRIARCDALLKKNKQGRYDISKLEDTFALDPDCYYPYTIRVYKRPEPLVRDGMVSINQEIKDEIYTEEDYVHWDSDLSSDSDEDSTLTKERTRKVDSLTALSLKTIFSRRCMGKVPRKLRKLKADKFDVYNDFDMSDNINNIIDNLNDDEYKSGGEEVVYEGSGKSRDKDSDTLVGQGICTVFFGSDSLLDLHKNVNADGQKNAETYGLSVEQVNKESEVNGVESEDKVDDIIGNHNKTNGKDVDDDETDASIDELNDADESRRSKNGEQNSANTSTVESARCETEHIFSVENLLRITNGTSKTSAQRKYFADDHNNEQLVDNSTVNENQNLYDSKTGNDDSNELGDVTNDKDVNNDSNGEILNDPNFDDNWNDAAINNESQDSSVDAECTNQGNDTNNFKNESVVDTTNRGEQEILKSDDILINIPKELDNKLMEEMKNVGDNEDSSKLTNKLLSDPNLDMVSDEEYNFDA